MTIGHDVVAAASRAWVWVPENAVTAETPEYLLARMPDWFEIPLELLRLDPRRPVAEVVDEVLDRAREFGLPEAHCWVKLHNGPDADEAFLARGGRLDETLEVLAVDISSGPPELGRRDPALELRWATDLETSRDDHRVGAEVFGGTMPPEDGLAAAAERGRLDLAAGTGSVVAYLDGVPVGTGGLSLVDGVARLWGGAVRQEARGRGVYRALLDARIRHGIDHGATMALVKGRVETSGPILRRAGFAPYGEERSYLVPLR